MGIGRKTNEQPIPSNDHKPSWESDSPRERPGVCCGTARGERHLHRSARNGGRFEVRAIVCSGVGGTNQPPNSNRRTISTADRSAGSFCPFSRAGYAEARRAAEQGSVRSNSPFVSL